MSNEDLIIVIFAGILILVIFLSFIIFFLLFFQKRHKRLHEENENIKMAFQHELLKTQLEIQEQTMKNISQEIHDNIGQVLSLVKLNINSMDCSKPVALKEKIDSSLVLVSKAINDLRDLSKSLQADAIAEMGLVKSIEFEFEMMKKAGNYQVVFEQEGEPYELSHQHNLILFRIFQEAANNTIKHANATIVTVVITYRADSFRMIVRDNGRGFDLTLVDHDNSHGIGLRNLRNRANIIGAELVVESKINNGTTINITLPKQSILQ